MEIKNPLGFLSGFSRRENAIYAFLPSISNPGTTQDSWLTDGLVADGALLEENLFRYDRVDQAMLDLQNGRIEVMMSDYVPAQALAKQLGGLNIVYHGVLSSGPMNIVIPDGDAELQQAIDEIIKQLQDEGFIDGLAVKYFAE